jgi:hypothetical protein
MQVSAPDDGARVHSQFLQTIPTVPFEIAVVVDTGGHDVSGARFSVTELSQPPVGLIRIQVTYPTGVTINSAEEGLGQYDLTFGGCAPTCETLEAVRIQYVDFVGALPNDTLVEVSGHGPDGDGGDPVIYDCNGAMIEAPMGGADGGPTSCTPMPAGSLLINGICLIRSPTPEYITAYADCEAIVSGHQKSVGVLKARYRTSAQ